MNFTNDLKKYLTDWIGRKLILIGVNFLDLGTRLITKPTSELPLFEK